MADTNWPNPEWPGYPMLPERDGWHMTTHSGATSPTVSFWRASEEVWKSGSSSYPPDYLAHPMRKYIGPVLTPTQLTELLAGERERCAVISEREFLGSTYPDEQEVYARGRSDAARDIRNIGDTP